MAAYYIDIIDTVSLEKQLVIEVASKSGIVLAWSGGDAKDELAVVGSNLIFDFAHREKVDAKFIKYFTGNETRFRVELKNSNDDTIIWQGHVLPDQYREPYTNGVTFVSFTASCGLGRLKGKYLPESFYKDEKSLIAILCKILTLTNVNIDLIFNPAIENSVQKDWNQIYIDTAIFAEKNKKKDAYSILETLLQDTLCVCYQADNCWQVEGINKRHVRPINAKKYNITTGQFIETFISQKLLKKVTAFVSPDVTMIPPYNMITVSHDRIAPSLPATIAQESNDGWAVFVGVIGEIYASDWNGNNEYYAKAVEPDYYTAIKKRYTYPFGELIGGIPDVEAYSDYDFINLKNKIFVYKYQELTISAKIRILKFSNGGPTEDVLNSLLYAVSLNGILIFSNKKAYVPSRENLVFKDGEAKLNFDWIVPEEGLIDFKFWRPDENIYPSNILGFEIIELKIAAVAFEDKLIVQDIINDDFTIDKEIELDFSDDDTAFSHAFRLAKLKEATINYNALSVPIKSRFTQNGNFYSVVALDGANLIKDNINTTYDREGNVLFNLEVIYNYFGGFEMVIKTDFATTDIPSFLVVVYKNNDFLGSRKSWMQWTDAVYKIETIRYAKVVSNIIRRMFNEASEKIDVTVNNAVKFNDLILFEYVFDKRFVVTNCSWNLDENKSTLTLARAIYRDSGNTGSNPENIPPIVNAGLDIELSNSQTTASLFATAYDVDGFIASKFWTKLKGGFGDVVVSPGELATELQNLTEDIYEYKVEVTDNDGATAFDTVSIIRRKDYVANLFLVSAVDDVYTYQFSIGDFNPDFNLSLKGIYRPITYDFSTPRFVIKKNGVVWYTSPFGQNEVTPFTIGYKSTDVIQFEIHQNNIFPDINIGSSFITIHTIDFEVGAGNIIGLPLIAKPIPNPFAP